MNLVLDNREPWLHQCISKAPPTENITVSIQPLLLGDAALYLGEPTGKEILIIERKSLSDLLASIKDGRYEEQSHRLIHTSGLHPHNIIYIIEGMYSQLRLPADKKIVLSAITSLSYFKGFSVFRTNNIQETADIILAVSAKLHKELAVNKRPRPTYAQAQQPLKIIPLAVADSEPQDGNIVKKQGEEGEQAQEEPINDAQSAQQQIQYSTFVKKAKRDNITPDNIGEIMLCQIPGIHSATANDIIKQCGGGSFYEFMRIVQETPEHLNTIYLTSDKGKKRKLGSNIIQNIIAYLGKSTASVQDPHN